jgi:hypothetical protein
LQSLLSREILLLERRTKTLRFRMDWNNSFGLEKRRRDR